MTTMRIKKESWMGSIHDPLSCHRAKQKENQQKQKNTQKHTKHRTRNKNPTRHDTNTVRLVISWSINRNWNVSEKMITSTRQRQITKKPYRNLWAWEATQHNAETEAPPSQEPRDHKAQAARATISPIGNNLTQSKGQQWHCHGTRKVRSKRWNVVWTRAKVKTTDAETALRATSDSSQVCFVYLHHHEDTYNCQMGHRSE